MSLKSYAHQGVSEMDCSSSLTLSFTLLITFSLSSGVLLLFTHLIFFFFVYHLFVCLFVVYLFILFVWGLLVYLFNFYFLIYGCRVLCYFLILSTFSVCLFVHKKIYVPYSLMLVLVTEYSRGTFTTQHPEDVSSSFMEVARATTITLDIKVLVRSNVLVSSVIIKLWKQLISSLFHFVILQTPVPCLLRLGLVRHSSRDIFTILRPKDVISSPMVAVLVTAITSRLEKAVRQHVMVCPI